MENGAASPGRWQVSQCFRKIGATSLVNVGGGLFGSCPSTRPAQHSVPASKIDKYCMNFPTSPFGPRKTRMDATRKVAGRRGITSISGLILEGKGDFHRKVPGILCTAKPERRLSSWM